MWFDENAGAETGERGGQYTPSSVEGEEVAGIEECYDHRLFIWSYSFLMVLTRGILDRFECKDLFSLELQSLIGNLFSATIAE
jgi:hypothetical protein